MVSWISIANLLLIVMGVYYAIPDGASGTQMPYADLMKENDQLREENKNYERFCKNQNTAFDQLIEENKQLEEERNAFRKKANELSGELNKVSGELNKVKQSQGEPSLTKTYQDMVKKIAELEAINAELNLNFDEALRENDRLQTELQSVRQWQGEPNLAARNAELEARNAELEARNAELESHRQQVRYILEHHEKEIDKLKNELKAAKYPSGPESQTDVIDELARQKEQNSRMADEIKRQKYLLKSANVRLESCDLLRGQVEGKLTGAKKKLKEVTDELKTVIISGFNMANSDLAGPLEAISMDILLRRYKGKYGMIIESDNQSPMGLLLSLIMILAGMDEATQKNALELFSFRDITFNNVLLQTSVILKAVKRNGQGGELKFGSFGFFDPKDYRSANEEYMLDLERYVGTKFVPMEFKDQEKLLTRINSELSKYANGKIEEFLPQGSLASANGYVLINFMFLNVRLEIVVDKKNMIPGTFELANGRKIFMKVIKLTDKIPHGLFQDLSCACVILPCTQLDRKMQGQDTFLELLIVLPYEKLGKTLEAMEKKKSELGQESLFSYFYSGMKKKDVIVTIPSFDETSATWNAIPYISQKLRTSSINMGELFPNDPPYEPNKAFQRSKVTFTGKRTTVPSATESLSPPNTTAPVPFDLKIPYLYYVIFRYGNQYFVIGQGVEAGPKE